MAGRRAFGPPPGASLEIARHTAFPAVATAALLGVVRGAQRTPVLPLIEPSTRIPFSSAGFPIRKDFKQQA